MGFSGTGGSLKAGEEIASERGGLSMKLGLALYSELVWSVTYELS